MASRKVDRLVNTLAERFASAWRLLSDTTIFLSSTKSFARYENQLRNWRRRLESTRNDPKVIDEVRQELIQFRATLRSLGYDVKLGAYQIKLEGFRHDDATAEGFKRLVLFIARDNLYYLSGAENHIELDGFLERRLAQANIRNIIQKHYLWFRWRQNTLVFSGADTESKEEFEKLKLLVEEDAMFFIKRLKKLS